jgi:hypothetical protein
VRVLPADVNAIWSPVPGALIANNPGATTSATWLADVIDHYAASWPKSRRSVCVDNIHDRAWSAVLLDDGAKCLVDREAELATASLSRGKQPGEIVGAVGNLGDPRYCADLQVQTRLIRRPTEPAARATYDQVAGLGRDAVAADNAGDVTRAKTIAESGLAIANQSGIPLVKATALESLGQVELHQRDLAAATEHLKAAYFEYRSLGDQQNT